MTQKCQIQIFEAIQKIGSISVAYKCHGNATEMYAFHKHYIQSHHLIPDAVLPIPFWSQPLMMRPDAKVEKVYLYPKPVDFRKSYPLHEPHIPSG